MDSSVFYPGPSIDTNWFPNTQDGSSAAGGWVRATSPSVAMPAMHGSPASTMATTATSIRPPASMCVLCAPDCSFGVHGVAAPQLIGLPRSTGPDGTHATNRGDDKVTRQLFAGVLAAALLFSGAAIGQTCQGSITASAPDSRYVDNGDGTVTDTRTLLMWKQCVEGLFRAPGVPPAPPAPTPGNRPWPGHKRWMAAGSPATAIAPAQSRGIVVAGGVKRYGPAINATLFPNTPGAFWFVVAVRSQPPRRGRRLRLRLQRALRQVQCRLRAPRTRRTVIL